MVKSRIVAGLAVVSLMVLACCGGSPSPAQPAPAPTATPTPAPTPPPTLASQLPPGLVCDPTPPPLYGLVLKVHNRTTLDSRPMVINMNNFCGRAGFDPGSKFCFTRTEGDTQSTACDYLAVGKAADTGRWGPTWSWNGQPCTGTGCSNHPDNQFLLLHRADGTFLACVSPQVPLSTDPLRPGNRCGICKITNGSVACNSDAANQP